MAEPLVERLIREARERGEFDDLPGAGRPLDLDDDELWWIRRKAKDEGIPMYDPDGRIDRPATPT
jgi:hypothetical protein